MVRIAQLVRASDCGSEGRGFEPLSSPQEKVATLRPFLFLVQIFREKCLFYGEGGFVGLSKTGAPIEGTPVNLYQNSRHLNCNQIICSTAVAACSDPTGWVMIIMDNTLCD